jgi:hypothetical protein
MPQRTVRRMLILFALVLFSTTIALAQASSSIQVSTIPAGNSYVSSWQVAQQVGSSKHKLIVVTLDQPQRRRSCHIQSFTKEKLVCSRGIGGSHAYLPQQVLALILPGFNEGLRIPMWLGFNAGLGTAIWGTVVLAAACPACAVGTGIAALICFAAAGALTYGDGQPDRLLYLAPGQELSGKLGSIQPCLTFPCRP